MSTAVVLRAGAAVVLTSVAWSQGVIGTFAGTEFLFPANRLLSLSAPLGSVQDVALDADGNLYASDRDNHVVVQARPDATLIAIAGNGLAGFSGDRGQAVNASLQSPQGLAIDAGGNLYIADSAGNRVRRVARDGTIDTIAGTGVAGFSGDGPATANQLNTPRGLAVDAAGNLYIADSANHRVRKVTPSGLMTTLAGTGTAGTSGDGGPANQAQLNTPVAVKVDPSSNVYVATIGSVRKISAANAISTLFRASDPAGLALDAQNFLYVSNGSSHVVVKVAPDGSSIVVAGNGVAGYSGEGEPATKASLSFPGGLEISASGVLYIADRGNLRVRRVDPDGTIRTVAGNGNYRFSGDGASAISASLQSPAGVSVDGLGNLLIADLNNNRIRKVTTDGIINTVAGNGVFGFGGDGGPAVNAALAAPQGVAADASGFYIADRINNRVRKVDLQGVINTVAGGAGFKFPWAVALDATGNLFVADYNNDRIVKVTPAGAFSTVAGGGSLTAEGVLATDATLNAPQGVAVDAQNRLYISDTDNNRIRVVVDGKINTIAGGGTSTGENVAAIGARVSSPQGLAVDGAGNLYYAETKANRVRRVSGGIVSTVVGVLGPGGYAGDGGLAVNALLSQPAAVALDSAGNLYIADAGNNRVRKVFAAPPQIQVSPLNLSFSGIAGGIRTAPRLVNIFSNDLSGLPFTVLKVNNSSWLNIFPNAGPTPASLEISADPGNLKSGSYQETIRVQTPNANPPSTDVSVQFTVADPGGPLQSVQPLSFNFAFVAGSPAKVQTLTIANLGGGTLSFSVTADNAGTVKWLSVNPASGVATTNKPALVNVTANPQQLQQGTYTGTVTVMLSTGPITTIPVTMTISNVPQTIRLSQTGLTFTGVAGGGAVPPDSFSVLNTGLGVMSWTAAVIARPGAPIFLTLSPAAGTSDAASTAIPSVTVTANVGSLQPGEYFNQIEVDSPTALNSPQYIPVVLEVLDPGQDPGPAVQPSELVFTGVAGAPPPGSQNLLVYNLRGASLNYRSQKTTANGVDWITYLPTEAAVDPPQPTRLVVQPDTTRLGPGIQQGVLTLNFNDGTTRKINVLDVVLAPASGSGGKSLRAAQAACSPKDLVPSLTVLGQGFTVAAGFPRGLIVKVLDDCGVPMTDGRVSITFSNGDSPIGLLPLQNGQWSGTWTPSATTDLVTLQVTAESTALGLKKTVEVSGTTRSTPVIPRITPGRVVNAANYAVGQPLAIGDIITIFGTNLASGESKATPPLDTVLAGTGVFLAGQDLPLVYASPNQVNAILPFDNLRPNTQYQLLVVNGDQVSVPEPIVIAATQPVIFQTDSGAAIFGPNGPIGSGNPAHVHDQLMIFAVGLGAVNGTVTPGAPPGPLSTASPVLVTIGDVAVSVSYAGLAPGMPGVYQVTVEVPDGVPARDQVPVVLSVMGQSSPAVGIPVQ